MGMTMAEKVLARVSDHPEVHAGEFVTARPDRLMAHEAFVACAALLAREGVERLWDADRLIVVLDHYFPAPTPDSARIHRAARDFVERFGIRHFLGHAGICHQVLSEQGFILPGELVLGTDSHTTTYGALGAAGAGIGMTEMAYVMATGTLWMQVPSTVRFVLEGRAPEGVMSKDVILHIAGRWGTEVAQYASIEFAGAVAARMGVAARMTVSNMGVELGAKFALFPADEVTLRYLEGRARGEARRFEPDADATYRESHRVDVSGLEPQVALPHNPGNVRPVSQAAGTTVDQAFLGSCTNARLEDLAVAAAVLRGRRVHPRTRLLVTPASAQVYRDALAAGYLQTLAEAGAAITASGCGACPGGHMGVLAPGERCVSSTNRNFQGRMGSPEAEVYLASPATVAASAVAGAIADPREFWRGRALEEET